MRIVYALNLGASVMSEAQVITGALDGDWRGSSGLAPCPICQIEGRKDQRGLSLKDASGRTLLTCHKSGCKAVDILGYLKAHGIIQGHRVATQRSQAEVKRNQEETQRKAAKTLQLCNDTFSQAVSIDGTPGATYLESRGIVGLQGNKMCNTLRFHPSLYHSSSKQTLPTLVARIRGPKGNAMGLHRTFLRPDGTGKADVPSNKMMLGPASGGAVRFGPDQPIIALAEGIETALSISRASRLTVWATLSTSGLKSLILPPAPVAEVVVICADHDDAGLAAAEATATRLEAEGRAVSVIAPQAEGMDFNDVLQGAAHE
jgi:Toprim domain-containing protein